MRKKMAVTFIFLVIAAVLSVFSGYCADERSYFIAGFNIDAEIDSSGNMDVHEEITYEFSGSFRGVYRTLKKAGSDGFKAVEVYEKKDGMLNQFVQNDSEAENSFQLIDEGDSIRLKIFSASKDERKTFAIKYKTLNVASKYMDIGELYWKFIGEDTEVKTEDVNIKITLPEGAEREDIRVFGHGPLSGVSEIVDSRTVLLRTGELPPRTFVEARVLFPSSLIKDSVKTVNEEALERIMEEEKGFADEANAKRIRARVVVGISLIYILFEFFLIAYLYFKYDREYKTEFEGKYYRELPGNYSPAVLSILWNFGKVNPRDITATLMDLVRRKYLKLNVINKEIKGLIKNRVESEYAFELNKEADEKSLSPHEKYLIEWLLFTIGNGEKVTLEDIEKSARTREKARDFKASYDAWTEYVKIEADKYSFFDRNAMKGQILGVIIAVFGMVFGGFTAAKYGNILGFFVLVFASVILLIYSLSIRRRSKSGADQFKRWKAFTRFLKHFSSINKAELPAVTIWEHYLVYAITLGVAKEVIKQLKLVFSEDDFKNAGLTYLHYGHYGNRYSHFDAIESVTNAVVNTTESVYRQAMSKMSSGRGKGGGFSGGGGGGGGAGAF